MGCCDPFASVKVIVDPAEVCGGEAVKVIDPAEGGTADGGGGAGELHAAHKRAIREAEYLSTSLSFGYGNSAGR